MEVGVVRWMDIPPSAPLLLSRDDPVCRELTAVVAEGGRERGEDMLKQIYHTPSITSKCFCPIFGRDNITITERRGSYPLNAWMTTTIAVGGRMENDIVQNFVV